MTEDTKYIEYNFLDGSWNCDTYHDGIFTKPIFIYDAKRNFDNEFKSLELIKMRVMQVKDGLSECWKPYAEPPKDDKEGTNMAIQLVYRNKYTGEEAAGLWVFASINIDNSWSASKCLHNCVTECLCCVEYGSYSSYILGAVLPEPQDGNNMRHTMMAKSIIMPQNTR